jgi:hypothetical protein
VAADVGIKQVVTVNHQQVFDDQWLAKARSKGEDTSWVNAVLETLDASGQIYLCNLRLWFNDFPVTGNDKRKLRERLESFQNEQHLGAVNELAWWTFMRREGIAASVVATAKTPRPDFQLAPPSDCFVEVSTLNVSEKDAKKRRAGQSVALDHRDTIRRVVGKLTEEKHKQLIHAVNQKKPAVLVLFDYTEWSAFGTSCFGTLAEFLLGTEFGFKSLPPELSALVYLERKVLDGRIALSRARSAVYYNPLAVQPLSSGSFPSLKQFRSQLVSSEPLLPECWVHL